MEPISIEEKLLFSTVRLETLDGSSGTGFFFNFRIEDMIFPVLITNKHVINNNPNETIKFRMHTTIDGKSSNGFHESIIPTQWHFHPEKDICFCFINPIIQDIKNKFNIDIYYLPFDENLILTNDKLAELDVREEVIMIGYPNGLWDSIHNYPLFRNGYTAAHPAYDFNEKSIGLVDMACFPGSSGSPIFIYNKNSFSDKIGNLNVGQGRLIFLGILFAGPVLKANGELISIQVPTQQKILSRTDVMINLGYYIKSYELESFKQIIKRLITQ